MPKLNMWFFKYYRQYPHVFLQLISSHGEYMWPLQKFWPFQYLQDDSRALSLQFSPPVFSEYGNWLWSNVVKSFEWKQNLGWSYIEIICKIALTYWRIDLSCHPMYSLRHTSFSHDPRYRVNMLEHGDGRSLHLGRFRLGFKIIILIITRFGCFYTFLFNFIYLNIRGCGIVPL